MLCLISVILIASLTPPAFDDLIHDCSYSTDSEQIYLVRAQGDLVIHNLPQDSVFEAYFHVPVRYEHQVPLYLEVEGAKIIDYRFVELAPPNIMVSATLSVGFPSTINWRSWVLVLGENWSDLPDSVPIPEQSELPDSVLAFLQSTDCAQLDAPIVQSTADQVLGGTENLMELADSIYSYCYDIPWTFPHDPIAFDAVYALTWGNSCTGHAHAAAALFRANGIPSRTLMNCVLSSSNYDHHWGIDFYVPDYGWVRMDPSIYLYPHPPYWEIVTMVCNPEDEFPIWFLPGAEASWHTSDHLMTRSNPDWGMAHLAESERLLVVSTDTAAIVMQLAEDVFNLEKVVRGLPLGFNEHVIREQAFTCQENAYQAASSGDINALIANLESARSLYQSIDLQPEVVFYEEDFEIGASGWTHGGDGDEWEIGTPTYGPAEAHSGVLCWGTDLDGDYEDNSDNWLLSPVINLDGTSSVFMDFWVWNHIVEVNRITPWDYLWAEVTTDGSSFHPICSRMAGINEDRMIPNVGGWAHAVLDLHRYSGEEIQVRFRFYSDNTLHQAGSYIDDVRIYGRHVLETGIAESGTEHISTLACYPNPCRDNLSIQCHVPGGGDMILSVYDLAGRVVYSSEISSIDDINVLNWDCCSNDGSSQPSGIYYVHLTNGDTSESSRVVLIR